MFLILNADWVQNAWRSIIFFIDTGIYLIISGAYGLINELAGIAILSDEVFVNFTQRIYIIIGLFILFKTGLALLNMLLNPDNFYDAKAGGSQLVKKIVIALTLLILIPTIFSNLFRFQYLILNEGILPSLILGSSDNMNNIVATGDNAGHVIAGITFRAFFTPALKNLDGTVNYGNPAAEGVYTNPNTSIWEFKSLINATSGNQYIFNYSTIVSSIVGGLAAFLMISFAFEIALRSVKLAFLQLIAPVPIILSIDPKKGEALKAWTTEVGTTFIDLFMRLSLIYFAVFLIAEIFGGGIIPTVYRYNELGIAESGPLSPLGAIFIIFGILMFVKIAPKLIYSMVGMKEPSGGLGLNPWKKLMGIPLAGKLAGATTSGIDAKMHGKRFNSGFKKGWDAVPGMGGTNTLKSLRTERTKALEAEDKKRDLDYERKRGKAETDAANREELENLGGSWQQSANSLYETMKAEAEEAKKADGKLGILLPNERKQLRAKAVAQTIEAAKEAEIEEITNRMINERRNNGDLVSEKEVSEIKVKALEAATKAVVSIEAEKVASKMIAAAEFKAGRKLNESEISEIKGNAFKEVNIKAQEKGSSLSSEISSKTDEMAKTMITDAESNVVKVIKEQAKQEVDSSFARREGSFIKEEIFNNHPSLSAAYDSVEQMKKVKKAKEAEYEVLVKRIQSGDKDPDLIEKSEKARTSLTLANVNLERAKSNYEIELNSSPSVAAEMKAYEGAKADNRLEKALDSVGKIIEKVKPPVSNSNDDSKQQPKKESLFGKKENQTYLDEKAEKEIAANKAYVENNFEKPDMSRYDISDRFDLPKKDDIDIID